MTNYEKIKNMSIEEMVIWIDVTIGCGLCAYCGKDCSDSGPCVDGIKKWLESEVEDE